jgi:ATP-binding cassette subfamily B protein
VPRAEDDTRDEQAPLPGRWRGDVAAHLESGEDVLCWFAPDLDAHLRYRANLVVLTDRRLLHGEPESGSAPIEARSEPSLRIWRSWPLSADLDLKAHDRAGVGTLELFGPDGRLAFWRYTFARSAAARRLIERLETVCRGDALAHDHAPPPRGETAAPSCPACGAVLPADQAACPTCAPAAPPRSSSVLLRLAAFARPHAGMVALGFVLALASTGAGLVPPYLTMPLMDRVLIPYENRQPVDFGLVPLYLLGLLGAAVLAWLLSWARSFVLAWVSERITADLRNRTYEHLHRLSLEFFGGKRTGDLMARLGSDTDRLNSFLSDNVVDFSADVLMIAGTAVILLSLDPVLALATLVPFPLIAWLVYRVRGRLRRGFQRSGRAWAEMISVLADTIPGIRVVKAFAQEGREIDRYRASNDHVLQANDRVNTIWTFFWPLVTLLTQAGTLVVWAFGAWRIYDRQISVGVLTAFLAYIGRFYVRLESMSRMVQATQRAGASAQRIFEILDRVPSVPEPAQPIHPGPLRGEIALRGVGFRFGNRQILEDIDLTIRPGEMIGLVGPSGAGKSTLVDLVCRFYDVAAGAIRVDGVDIRSFPVAEYRRHIGLVLQDPFLFFGTVAENIAYGRPDAGPAEIIAAARAARAHEFILRLPDGYDSLVGERGQSLSGGERQRISVARALLIDPRILILDEATSSVDTETEREIQEALDYLIQGRTTIAIAHRLSTLRRADRLVVLEQGRIAEVGRHHELLERSGAYARLYRAQLELEPVLPGDGPGDHPLELIRIEAGKAEG